MKTIYSMENLKVLLFYVMLPLTIILILFYLFTKIYSNKRSNADINYTNYVINYWSNFLGIFFAATLLSVSIGFAAAFIKTLNELEIVAENIFLYYFFMLFPIIPCIFLLSYIRKFLKNIKKKEELEKRDNNGKEE